VLLCALAGGLSTAACGLSPRHTPRHPAPRVLGQPTGTPQVVGQAAPDGTGLLTSVSCATATRCWAVGSPGLDATPVPPTVVLATKDGGKTWSGQVVPPNLNPALSSVSCPTVTTCMAVGSDASGSDLVLTTHDGGAAWSQAAAPASANRIAAVTCQGIAMCIAIATNGTTLWSSRSTDFGTTWQQAGNLPAAFLAATGLECGDAGGCLVAGYVPTSAGHGAGALALSADDGQTWEDTTVPAGLGLLQGVACATSTSCFAAGTTSTTVSNVVPAKGQLLQSVDGGHTWTSGPVPPVDDTYGLACPSARQCAMVGTVWAGTPPVGTGAVAQSVDGGQTFTPSSSAYVPLTLVALSCPTTAACIAVGGDTLARITLQAPATTHVRTPTTGGSL
jgi:photosystem II stability/assembly factor-like uncharacterized protein